MNGTNEAAVNEHMKNMGIPESTGRHILEAAAVVEGFLKNQKEITRINTASDENENTIKERLRAFDLEYLKKQQALDRERNEKAKTLNQELAYATEKRKTDLAPLHDRINQVKRIIAMLRIAGTIQPVRDIEDSEITTYHGEYLEWLEYLFFGDYLKIRLLITENRKPKNKYSLLAYGRCAFHDESLLNLKRVYMYGTPNLNDHRGGFTVRLELGSFPDIADAKAHALKCSNKHLKQFIDDYVKLKSEFLEVTANYKLSDFEQITAQEKAKERLK